MSLHGLRKSKETGFQSSVDVRRVNLDFPQKEADADFLESLGAEFAYTEVEWQGWIEEYNDRAETGDWGICLLFAWHLKIIAPERISKLVKPEHKLAIRDYLVKYLRENDPFAGEYCYLFSETPAQLFPDDERRSLPRILNSIRSIAERGDIFNLAETAAWAKCTYPGLLTKTELEKYREQIFSVLHDTHYSAFDYLTIAAYLRMLYPERIEYLEYLKKFTAFELKKQIANFANSDRCYVSACVKIITAPEIPGLTTWSPKKTGEPQFADNIPEQPENLKL